MIDPVNASAGIGITAIVLIIVGSIVLSILPIILFFKVWGMTNDVRYMSQKMGAMLKKMDAQNEQLARLADNHDYVPPYESQNGWGEREK